MSDEMTCERAEAERVMCPEHPRWEEFATRLGGPEGCDFTRDPIRGWTWKCRGGDDRSFATAILTDMGMDVTKSLAYFTEHGGYCDCEILFNVQDDDLDNPDECEYEDDEDGGDDEEQLQPDVWDVRRI